MTHLEALIIAVVQGITEFLPVSSTGHMIITESLLGVPSDDFTKAFTVSIQFGSILSVIILYWKRFFKSLTFYYKLFLAFIPSAIIGLLLKNYIDMLLGSVLVVAISLLTGGIILLFIDRWFRSNENNPKEDISYPSALKIGLFQVVSMIPGVSRSAATIIGGLTQKLDRKRAAEFSFFLAVPTMFAATCLELFDIYDKINKEQIFILAIGNVVAFLVAMLAIKAFIGFLTRHGFRVFGYYRIVIGLAILILLAFGIDLKLV